MNHNTNIKTPGSTDGKLAAKNAMGYKNAQSPQLLLHLVIMMVFMFISFTNAFTQNQGSPTDEFTTTIKMAGRYVEDTGIELRYFPEKRLVMEAGFRNGFIIERSVAGENDFAEIARLLP